MIKTPFILRWLRWRYTTATRWLLNVWGNLLWFNLEYFSVKGLLRSWLSHWRGDKTPYAKGFDPLAFLTSLGFNLISRTLGALVRTFVIIFALILEVIIFIFGLIIFLAWLFLPFLILLVFLYFIGILF